MATNVPNGIIDKIRAPSADILLYLDQLASQISLSTAASDSDLGGFATGTMSRRNPKIFVIGFLPPDNPINFVPYSPTTAAITSVQSPAIGKPSIKVKVPGTGDKGEQPRTSTITSAADLRKALSQAFVNAIGRAPSEATLALMYAQCLVETGSGANPNTVAAPNYNFGSSHSTHNQKVGFYTDNDPTKDAPGFKPPNGGTYFVANDSTNGLNKDGTPKPGSKVFRVAFNSFGSLQDGANYQVAFLLAGWPDAANAQTPQEFVDATKKTSDRSGYFGVSADEYAAGLDTKLEGYRSRFPDPIGADNKPDLTLPDITANAGIPPGIASPNVATDLESDDPLKARLGRSIQVADEDRQKLVAKQTSAVQQQISLIKSMPPLLMLINPSEFTREYEHTADDSAKTRQGNVVHVWLERPSSISSSGVTAGQYVMTSLGHGGLNNTNRIQSISYRNLLSLVMTYKNNGLLFAGGEVPGSQGVPILAMSLFIYYDDHIYIGSFDDFGVDDDADKPHNMNYNFKFNVRYDIELDGANTVTDINVAQPLGFSR